jgi:hypothetical protein
MSGRRLDRTTIFMGPSTFLINATYEIKRWGLVNKTLTVVTKTAVWQAGSFVIADHYRPSLIFDR